MNNQHCKSNEILSNRQWMYLEPIFTSEDISRQLPVESKKYNSMERTWRRIMRNAFDCPNVSGLRQSNKATLSTC